LYLYLRYIGKVSYPALCVCVAYKYAVYMNTIFIRTTYRAYTAFHLYIH